MRHSFRHLLDPRLLLVVGVLSLPCALAPIAAAQDGHDDIYEATQAGNPEDGEAEIRYLGHSGWAIQTKSRFLIFDYWEEAEPEGARALADGYVDPQEIRDLSVVVFISHGHRDHWDPRVLEWRETIPDITYVFGWRAEDEVGEGAEAGDEEGAEEGTEERAQHVYCDFERRDFTLGNMRVRTIVHDFDGIPEAAFVVDVDGVTIFHSGDHGNGPPPFRQPFVENLEYLAGIAPEIDLAFIPLWGEESYVIETLRPTYTFPMHDVGREHQYARFAARAPAERLPTEVVAAAARGDRFLFADGQVADLRE